MSALSDFWKTLGFITGVDVPGMGFEPVTPGRREIEEWRRQLLLNYIFKSPYLDYQGPEFIPPEITGGSTKMGMYQPGPSEKIVQRLLEMPTKKDTSGPPPRLLDLYKTGFGTASRGPRGKITGATGLEPADMLRGILSDWSGVGESEEGGKLYPSPTTQEHRPYSALGSPPQSFKQLEDLAFYQLTGEPLYSLWGQYPGKFGASSMPWQDWTKQQKNLATTIQEEARKTSEQKAGRYYKSERQRESGGDILSTLIPMIIKQLTGGMGFLDFMPSPTDVGWDWLENYDWGGY